MTTSYDRAREVKEFDESKIGVKGLVDAGSATIPRIFHHPSHNLPSKTHHPHQLSIPTIDLSLPHPTLVDLIRDASRNWGFFNVVHHGIPQSVLDRTISAVRSFNELPTEAKSKYYTRDPKASVTFSTNVDLYRSEAASWRDTIQMLVGPVPVESEKIPSVCREELLDWDGQAMALGERLMGLLSEGLGLGHERIKEMSCLQGRVMVAHYYPYCPQPDLTVGLAGHTDPGVLTVLLQDMVGGLQVKVEMEGEDVWVDVKPVPGSIVINVGDLLQIMSNDEYNSVAHRVLANPSKEPRISIAVFFNPGRRGETDLYGPLPELVSHDKPARYRDFTMTEFLGAFFEKDLRSKSLVHHFAIRTEGSIDD
ncbi:hypothetical protein QJS04_geneDACA012016 [Acorus gramineus]|uniref:Fe2OG dioxygenase domain-containing protein n=1 Tax=Acorus gramineus TaxID=55184 RepID=A0AAV9AGC5_ACOGR|nr:hypothetical protein QJS04_geneDACA012016 [Acorus gramineus]